MGRIQRVANEHVQIKFWASDEQIPKKDFQNIASREGRQFALLKTALFEYGIEMIEFVICCLEYNPNDKMF